MDRLYITLINVGYGEAIYIECHDESRPDGVFTMLIDGGSAEAGEFADRSTGRVRAAEYLRRLGRKHLDVLVNTHIHEDHLCGLLPVVEFVRPGEYWQTLGTDFCLMPPASAACEQPSARKFLAALQADAALRQRLRGWDCPVRRLQAGQTLTPCPGLTIQVLGPTAERAAVLEATLMKACGETDAAVRGILLSEADAGMNNYSLVLLLDYCGTKILLPGDTNCLGYGEIDPSLLRADLFKVGHHGQRDGVSESLLRAIAPGYVACCASSDRRYESADPVILEWMRQAGAKLYFSDCPVDGVPPHEALVFSIGPGGDIQAAYRR